MDWQATCICGWTVDTDTYTEAGEAARGHGDVCEDASTEVAARKGKP